jgi:hypothetical protein
VIGRRGFRAAVVVPLALLLAGCATITYEADLIDRMVAMNRIAEASDYERVGTFSEDKRAVFVIAQLITVIDADLEDAVREALDRWNGDAVINLRIHEENDIVDVVVGAIGNGWVNTRSVTLEGDVIRWTGADADRSRTLAAHCHEVRVPDAGGERTGHLCMSP